MVEEASATEVAATIAKPDKKKGSIVMSSAMP